VQGPGEGVEDAVRGTGEVAAFELGGGVHLGVRSREVRHRRLDGVTGHRGRAVRDPHHARRTGFLGTDLLTPESTSYAELSIDDYRERTKQTIEAWNGMNGRQGGDPAKLAATLIQLAGFDEPPLRWAAGADAVRV
jgi:hypothetical protein